MMFIQIFEAGIEDEFAQEKPTKKNRKWKNTTAFPV